MTGIGRDDGREAVIGIEVEIGIERGREVAVGAVDGNPEENELCICTIIGAHLHYKRMERACT